MPQSTDPSRDLLFGLLALQTGLIDQGALFAAFAAWARDKARPLADHLGDRGGLDTDGRAAVGQLQESLDDWDRAMTLAADTDILAVRLGRATTLSLSNDYHAALAEAAAADWSLDDRADLRMTSALAHAALSGAIRRDQSLTPDARALGVATQLAAALGQIGQARRAPAYRDARRLYRRLGDHDFEPLREQPAFRILLMDLAFPAQPFAYRD